MSIKYKKVSDFNRGILIELLMDAYSFNNEIEKECKNKWQENNDFSSTTYKLQINTAL